MGTSPTFRSAVRPLLRAWRRGAFAAALGLAGAVPASAQASPDVPVEHPVYALLDTLDTAGLIHTRLSGNRPCSRDEIARLLHEAADLIGEHAASAYAAQLAPYLVEFRTELAGRRGGVPDATEIYWKPLEAVGWLGASRSGPRSPDDVLGRPIVDGRQVFLRAETHAVAGPLAGWLEGELQHWPDDFGPARDAETRGRTQRGAARLSLAGFDLTAGRNVPEWGPRPALGGDGLILTRNPQPIPMVSLRTSEPLLLPWIFSALGPMGWEIFTGLLEDGRDVSRALIGGMRVAARPLPWLEGALFRGFLFGGEDRPINVGRMLAVVDENNDSPDQRDISDQLAGGDVRVRIPLPLGLGLAGYVEGFGEDEAGGLPYKWSVRGGAHLVGLPPARGLELRFDYARIHRSAYQHGIYKDGWTYRGEPIGHHVGPGNDDLAGEVACALPIPGGHGTVRVATWASHEMRGRRSRPGFPGEQSRRVGVTAQWGHPTGVRLTFEAWWLRVRRVGGVHGKTDEGAYLAIGTEVRL